MYDAAIRREALQLLEAGASLQSISRDTGITRSALREWRSRGGTFAPKLNCPCPRCTSEPLPLAPYLYLLGQFLGDGCISRMGRTWVLRIACCDAYPGINAETVAAIHALVANPVTSWRVRGART